MGMVLGLYYWNSEKQWLWILSAIWDGTYRHLQVTSDCLFRAPYASGILTALAFTDNWEYSSATILASRRPAADLTCSV